MKEIQETIATIDPMPGAKEFLDELRSLCQVLILSDTFEQFAGPLMKKLGMPTIFCNTLEVADDGEITGLQDARGTVKIHDCKGAAVYRLRYYCERRQPQRPRNDKSKQSRLFI